MSIVIPGKLRIGLISDTHIAAPDEKLPEQLWKAFEGVDFILHAGDIWVPSVLDDLETIAPVKAAWGDDDIEADLGGDERMMDSHVIYLDNATIWLMHFKPPYGRIVPRENNITTAKRPIEPAELPSVVVFGHLHVPLIEKYKGVLIVNPGSATWPEYQPKPGTVALLELDSGTAEARIVQL